MSGYIFLYHYLSWELYKLQKLDCIFLIQPQNLFLLIADLIVNICEIINKIGLILPSYF